MLKNEIKGLISFDRIFDFFKRADYNVEIDRTTFPVAELIEKQIEGDVWTVINETNRSILIVKSSNYNRKSYRDKVNNYLKELAGTQIIFYTNDFTYYNLTLIFDGIFNIKFNPSTPDIDIVRIFEAFENQEDLFDYTKQDINFILLKRQLTAKILKDAIKEGDNSSVKLTFQEGGLRLIGASANKVIVSYDDAPIRDMVIDVKLEYNSEVIIDEDIESTSRLYKQNTSRDLKLVCFITKRGIIYYWLPYSIFGFIGFINQINEDVIDEVLESLIAQVSSRTAFNSETFHQQFGTHSPFYILGISAFQQFFDEEQEKIKIMYEEWKSRFSKVYQTGDLDQELFIKHAYLSLIIKTVLISKFASADRNTSKDKLGEIIKIFEERGVPIFLNDFFQWTSEEIFVQKEIFKSLHKAEFIIDDLFRTIYQEMVTPATRHALGEFYTPAPLAHKMVEELYKFGQYVLDPSCGSGTFLVEILNLINNSNKNIQEKVGAVSRIYGFDVNPIAVLVARSNLLLLTDKLFGERHKIPINIYLADSLNPIQEFTTGIETEKIYKKIPIERRKQLKVKSLDKWGMSNFGETERFNMPSINDSIVINVKFFRYYENFGELLKELDKNLSEDVDFNKLISRIYGKIDVKWLDEYCEGSSEETLKENFEYIAEKFFNLVKRDKNHIWAYLLYNAIGVKKMKDTMDGVDLIIGNPPWLTISGILSYEYKEKVKLISKGLDIYVGGKHAPNTELSSIFFYKCRDLYLRKNGKIFFVLTAGIETGDQHSKFRLFNGFKNIFIWKFSEDVFRIHNICLGAIYGEQPLIERMHINTKIFDVSRVNKNWEFNVKEQIDYVPYNLSQITKESGAKRFIPSSDAEVLLPLKRSKYETRFNKGATIVPRSFFFVKMIDDRKIVPDKSLIQKVPWNFYPFEEIDVEREYIYPVCKSTGLVPFHLLSLNKCFLPIELNNYSYQSDKIKPKAEKLFNLINNKYKEIQENDQRAITDLWQRINFNKGLSNPKQLSKLKLIYNSTGSILKAAIIKGNIIVDYKLYFMSEIKDINEAYYLCAIMNSPILTNQLQKVCSTGASGSVRNIEKKVFDFPIPIYNPNNRNHVLIREIGKNLEIRVKNIIKDLREKEFEKLKQRFQCNHCGKDYSKNMFERYKKKHQDDCKKVKPNYFWSDEDWIDLNTISLGEVELSRMKVQNVIFNDNDIKNRYKKLDKLVIQLLKSEK